MTALFHEAIYQEIRGVRPGKTIVFIDDGKIDPSVLKKITSEPLQKSHAMKLLAIYPQNKISFEIDPEYKIPFSPQLLLNLSLRALNRGAHDTMDYDAEKTLQIVISFTLLYKNVGDYKQHYLSEAQFSEMLPVPFHQEVSNVSQQEGGALCPQGHIYFQEFVGIMREVIKNIKAPFESLKGAETKHLSALAQFLKDEEKIQKLSPLVNYGGKQEWMAACDQILGHFSGFSGNQKENNMNASN